MWGEKETNCPPNFLTYQNLYNNKTVPVSSSNDPASLSATFQQEDTHSLTSMIHRDGGTLAVRSLLPVTIWLIVGSFASILSVADAFTTNARLTPSNSNQALFLAPIDMELTTVILTQ